MAPPKPTSTPPRPAGTSRLLAMKFMSRLGPTDSTPTVHSPLASGPSTPTNQRAYGDDGDDNERSSKRRRTSGGAETAAALTTAAAAAATGSPVSAGATSASLADMEATMRASMDEEERRRQLAVKKRAAELGDEHWTWDAPLPPQVAAKLAASKQATLAKLPYTVVRVGYAEIDESTAAAAAADSVPVAASYSNRATSSTKPSIMRFNMKKAAGADETDDASNDDHDTKHSKKRSRSEMDAYSRKKDMPKLKNLTSLSSQGGQSAMKCHRCGKPGHKAMECPAASKRSGKRR